MVLDQAANFARDATDTSVASGDTTISVNDASTFPDPGNGEYNCIIWDPAAGRPDQYASVEVVRVTGRDTTNNDLTVTRGQEGTSGASHPSGSAVMLAPTAKMFSDIDSNLYTDEQAQDAVGNNVGAGLSYDDASGSVSFSVVASGSKTLSGSTGTADTGVPVDSGHYLPSASPPADVDIAASLHRDDAGTGNWVIHLEENTTSVGNPTVGWKLIET